MRLRGASRLLVSVLVSGAFLLWLYSRVDMGALLASVGAASPARLALAFALLAPMVGFAAWRLRVLLPAECSLSMLRAHELVLAAGTVNVIVPSRLGDLSKAYFLRASGQLSGSRALVLMVLEKIADLGGLWLWLAVGLALRPPAAAWPFRLGVALVCALGIVLVLPWARWPRTLLLRFAQGRDGTRTGRLARRVAVAWQQELERLRGRPSRLAAIIALSAAVWLVNLCQIWLFAWALGQRVPFLANLSLAPLAVLSGLLPFTVAGAGSRDVAITLLYAPFLATSQAAALGVFCTARYIVLAGIGAPVLAARSTTRSYVPPTSAGS